MPSDTASASMGGFLEVFRNLTHCVFIFFAEKEKTAIPVFRK